MNIFFTANPGVFDSTHAVSSYMWNGAVMLAIVLFISFGILALSMAAENKAPRVEKVLFRVAVALFTAAVITVIGLVVSTLNGQNEDRQLEAEYSAGVADWLHDDYGIEATDGNALALTRGREYTVDYNGEATVIHVDKDMKGGLVLMGESGKKLDVIER
jgi:hypothetical protein